MKRKMLFTLALFMVAASGVLFAEDHSPFSLQLQTDFAYYPKSDCITGESHFAPITSPYKSLEFRTVLNASYKLQTPLGGHWLLKDANLIFTGGLELSPVSVRPMVSIGFTPLPFLVLKTGASLGWGWNYLGIEGLCHLNKDTMEYEHLSTFSHPYYDVWASATLQFDTGAVISGDWSHLVMLATFSSAYSGIAGLDDDGIFEWQCSKNKACGLSYELQTILAYQMPLALRLAGVMYKMNGYYNGDVYGEYDKSFNGTFPEISISPVLQFSLGKSDSLFCLFDFSSRRSFDKEFESEGQSLLLNNTGREWYFKRIALSWSHRFM